MCSEISVSDIANIASLEKEDKLVYVDVFCVPLIHIFVYLFAHFDFLST